MTNPKAPILHPKQKKVNEQSKRLEYSDLKIKLPNNMVVKGFSAQILTTLYSSSEEDPVTRESLAEKWYPDEGSSSYDKVSANISRAKKLLKDTGYEVVRKITDDEQIAFFIKHPEAEAEIGTEVKEEAPAPVHELSETEDELHFTLPNGQLLEVGPEVNKLLTILENTSQKKRVRSQDVAEALKENESAKAPSKNKIKSLVDKANDALADSPFKIQGTRGQKGGYFITEEQESDNEQSLQEVLPKDKTPDPVPPESPANLPDNEAGYENDDSEFGPFSREEIALLASALNGHDHDTTPTTRVSKANPAKPEDLHAIVALEKITGEKIRVIEDEERIRLIDYGLEDISKDRAKADEELKAKKRQITLEKTRQFINSSEFDSVMESIAEQDPKAWYLLTNLQEIEQFEVKKGPRTILSGLQFIMEWRNTPAKDRNFGQYSAVKEAVEEPTKEKAQPKRRTTTKVETKVTETIRTVQQKTEEVEVFQASKETPGIKTTDSETPKDILPEAIVKTEDSTQTVGAVYEEAEVFPLEAQRVELFEANNTQVNETADEKCEDENLEEKIKACIDTVQEISGLENHLNPSSITRLYSRVRKRLIISLVEGNLISVTDRKGNSNYKISPSGIATAIFFFR